MDTPNKLSEILEKARKQNAYDVRHRGKPDINAYPPTNPHDMEWGGVNPKYWDDLKKWEEMMLSQPKQSNQ